MTNVKVTKGSFTRSHQSMRSLETFVWRNGKELFRENTIELVESVLNAIATLLHSNQFHCNHPSAELDAYVAAVEL